LAVPAVPAVPARRTAPTSVWTVLAWVLLVAAVGIFAVAVPVRAGHPGQVFWLDVVDYSVAYLSAAGLLLGQRVADRRARWGWRFLGLAMISTSVGNLYFSVVVAHLADPPYPSIADAFYLAWYPFASLAVVSLLFSQVRRFYAGMAFDGLVAGLGATALMIAAVLGRTMSFSDDTGASRAELAVNLAYPLADLFVIMLLVAGGAMLGGRLTRALVLVGVGLGLTAVADTAYLVQDAVGSYVEGGVVDLLWLLGVLALAAGPAGRSGRAGITHPDIVGAVAGDGDGDGDGDGEAAGHGSRLRVSKGLLVVPIAFTVVAMAVIALNQVGMVPWQAVPTADGCVLAALLRSGFTFHEIRLEEGRKYARAHRQARTDDLTGLPNRRALGERCQSLLDALPGGRAEISLLLLDLDRFKEINDSLGHTGGDQLLIAVSERIRVALASDDELARLGGDEFAILTRGSARHAVQVADRVSQALAEPFEVAGLRLHVDASVGVSTAPSPAGTRAELLRQADVAMYRAKRRRSRVEVFAADAPAQGRDRLLAIEDQRAVLFGEDGEQHGHLLVHVQPQLRLSSGVVRPGGAAGGAVHGAVGDAVDGGPFEVVGEVVGAEALVRWQHPTRGLLFPASFLPLASTAGLSGRLAEVVLDQALAACSLWWHQGARVPVSVNHTADDVLDPGLIDRIEAALERHGLPAQALVVELTEDTLMADPAGARVVLGAIRALGAEVSIDDYGSGFSSLAYLRTLPADELKLDRTFIADLASSPVRSGPAAAIVRTTADLAHSLGLRLVAEGIEDASCLALLADLGCDVGQGYYLATPMPVGTLLSWMRDRRDALCTGATQVGADGPASG
jgi:diguanylate cyclase (GGDEF)-like protein